ncbi:diiron oxygenase [Nocardioides sp. KR10-350]|uniref:AurF N-oxygenase family protein n=1 Tax=Nocardioides cheoyonin TaxID=3156615 RepID=UPI0032B447AF
MTAVQQERRGAKHAPGAHVPQGKQGYFETLRTLSQASVDQHFEAFKDIAWDDPDFAVIPHDERWILSDVDELGAHPWYKSLPKERQIEIGMYRMALVAKVGLQFEQLLISGVMNYLLWSRNDNPEFRYATHEVTEETHHTQMFQELVNRVCPDAVGTPRGFKVLVPILATAGGWFPEAFFVGILAGEEPIDHLQKNILRGRGMHPLMNRIMQIHVAEEARHIGFAHQFLEHHVPDLNPVRRQILGLIYPVIMRLLCDVIMVPSKQARADMGIPDEVAKEIWWDAPESQKTLRDMFSDVRMLADDLGLRNRITRLVWKAMKIDGRSARFRSEPANAAS